MILGPHLSLRSWGNGRAPQLTLGKVETTQYDSKLGVYNPNMVLLLMYTIYIYINAHFIRICVYSSMSGLFILLMVSIMLFLRSFQQATKGHLHDRNNKNGWCQRSYVAKLQALQAVPFKATFWGSCPPIHSPYMGLICIHIHIHI